MKPIWKALGLCGSVCLALTRAEAGLATAPGQLGTDGIMVDFDSPRGSALSAPVEWSIAPGISIQYSTVGGPGSLGAAPLGSWSLRSNGDWAGPRTFAGVDGGASPEGTAASMVFDFKGTTVMSVGGLFNYVPDLLHPGGSPYSLYLAAFDVGGNLLEGHDLPVFTPGGFNAGVFYGIERSAPDIARIEIAAPFAVVDDLTIVVPEPGSPLLLCIGGVVLALRRFRRPL